MRAIVATALLASALLACTPSANAEGTCQDFDVTFPGGICKGVQRKGKYCKKEGYPPWDFNVDLARCKSFFEAECKKDQRTEFDLGGTVKAGYCEASGDKPPAYCTTAPFTGYRMFYDVPCSSDADCTSFDVQCCDQIRKSVSAMCDVDAAKLDALVKEAAKENPGGLPTCQNTNCVSTAASSHPISVVALALTSLGAMLMAA
jgi:hypothetical protein